MGELGHSDEFLERCRKANFTPDELRAVGTGLLYAVTLGDAGEDGALGDLGAGQVAWTPEKRQILLDLLAEMRNNRDA